MSENCSNDSRSTCQQNTQSTEKTCTSDKSLKRKLETDELTLQSVKHRRHSDHDLSTLATNETTDKNSSNNNEPIDVSASTVKAKKNCSQDGVAKTSDQVMAGINIDRIFESFQGLEVYFNDISRSTNSNYQEHVVNYICNKYRLVYKSNLNRICKKNNFHLMPTLNDLYTGGNKLTMRQFQRPLLDMPERSDEIFYLELKYIRLKENIYTCDQSEIDEVLDQFTTITGIRSSIICGCCFEENLSREDMFACVDGHEFCKDCIRQVVRFNVGLEKFGFRCMNGYCEREYSLNTLQQALEPTVFSSLVFEIQKRNILVAGIADVVTCPLCLTSMISTDHNDTLVRCINPICQKITCRLCKRLSHFPENCEQLQSR